MNFHLNKNHKNLENSLLDAITNFHQYETSFNTGKRNSIKKIELGTKTVVVKSFKLPNFINRIAYKYIRKSKAQRSYEYATKLLKLNIKTPEPIAYLEHSSLTGLKNSYYVSDLCDYDVTFRELLGQEDYPNRQFILKEFTKFTFTLHEKGIQFLDHSAANTLIKKNNDTYDFYLVDLNRMNFKTLSFDERMKNFSRLTSQKKMVKAMSEEYAKLSGKSADLVFQKMWYYTQQFRQKLQRKKAFKKRFLLRK